MLVDMESFDYFGSGAVSGRFSGSNAQRITTGGSTENQRTLPSTYGTAICGFAWKFESGASGDIFRFRTSGGSTICSVGIDSGGHFYIKNAAGTTVATGTSVYSSTAWHYLELKVFVNGASGTAELHVDGVAEIASTTGNYGSTNIGVIALVGNGSPTNSTWDDVYVCDTTGSVNNTFLGDVRIETLFPSGAGAHTQWTPDTGSNYARVNEHSGTYPDGDTSYVADGTVGDRDSYAFDNLSSLSGTVYGVRTLMYARKDDAGARQICAVARPGSTDYDGATVTLSTSYQTFAEIRETNPDTSSLWTISEVNSAEFGVKVVA